MRLFEVLNLRVQSKRYCRYTTKEVSVIAFEVL